MMRVLLVVLAVLMLAACDGGAARSAPPGAAAASNRDGAEPVATGGSQAANRAQSEIDADRVTQSQAQGGAVGHDAATRSAANEPVPTADSTRLAALRAGALPPGFDLVTAPRPFEFPRDHGPHPSFRHEWWYITGHLDTPDGEPFGFELTFFRFALKPPGSQTTSEPQSAWRARQIYMAHFAVTDIHHDHFAVAEHFARDALGLAGAQAEPFRVWLDDWSLAATPDSNAWRLIAADQGYALDLEIDPSAPMMLNGDAGFSRKSDAEGAASYYYSIPRMKAHGKLTRGGKSSSVQGAVWLDREWGSGSLGEDQQGWDWFALQLDDGSALMFYSLRTRSGQRDTHSAGTWLAPNGTTLPLTNDDVQIDTTSEWTSPRGTRYPARWQLRVPKLNLDVDIRPRIANQELNTSTRYWEGASSVTGTRDNKKIEGKAYVELVGY
jgi:predicted secreted hydrolase